MSPIQRREFCQGVASLVGLSGTAQAQPAPAGDASTGRPVRVTSLSFRDRTLEAIAPVVDAEAARGSDLIILPEMWQGTKEAPERIDGPSTRILASLARKHRTYVISPIYREADGRRLNSAVLIDREGRVVCVY